MYNYYEAVLNDVLDYIKHEIDLSKFETLSDLETCLNDELFIADSVTGNGSGSYTFSTYQAEENLSHNLELIPEVAEYFGCEPTIEAGWEHGPEWGDVSIRCYYLPQAISNALDMIRYDLYKAHED